MNWFKRILVVCLAVAATPSVVAMANPVSAPVEQWATCETSSGICLTVACDDKGSLSYRITGMPIARDELSLIATFADEDHVLSPRMGGEDVLVWTPFERNWVAALKRESQVTIGTPEAGVALGLQGSSIGITKIEQLCETRTPILLAPAVVCGGPIEKSSCG